MNYLRGLTYKQKNIALLIGGLLLAYFIYQRKVKDTFILISDCSNMEQQLQTAANAPQQLNLLRKEIKKLNEQISTSRESSEEVQQKLLDHISNYCQQNHMVLSEFSEPHQFVQNNYLLVTNTVELEGTYIPILKLIHQLENDFKLAKVSSVNFYTKTDHRTKKKYLYASLHLQHVRKI